VVKPPSHPRRGKITDDVDDSLSKAERRIIDKVAQGLINKQIADDLGVKESTVKMHLKNILRKREFTNRTQLAVWWTTEGFKKEVVKLSPLLEQQYAALPPQEHRFMIKIILSLPAGINLVPHIEVVPETPLEKGKRNKKK
jgi:DNA-binding CsgD family transcriptional regulator